MIPGIVFAAPSSGSGKTTVSCGMLRLLSRNGMRPAAFKCGPDYIDPMFHRQVLGIPTGNLDAWLMDRERIPERIREQEGTAGFVVIEGVMGYYDGLGGVSLQASTWDVADAAGIPVILVVDAGRAGSFRQTGVKSPEAGGMADAGRAGGFHQTGTKSLEIGGTADAGRAGRSHQTGTKSLEAGGTASMKNPESGRESGARLSAVVKEILAFRQDHGIRGVVLNRVSGEAYGELKQMMEADCGIPVLGYLPDLPELTLPSRHLGLFAPEELQDFRGWADAVADQMERTVDWNRIVEIAKSGRSCRNGEETRDKRINGGSVDGVIPGRVSRTVRLAVARDEAFSFYYVENQELLEKMGAELQFFSPLHDAEIPPDTDGLVLWGGYPERYAAALERNSSMRHSILRACRDGMPCVAECGGFLYLQDSLEGVDGKRYRMAGVLPGHGVRKEKLVRFGYMEARSLGAGLAGGKDTVLRGHEFHYWDCTLPGKDFLAAKPTRNQSYVCMVHTPSMLAGFPHFYYPGNPLPALHFLEQCLRYQSGRLAAARWDSIAKPIDSLGLLEDYIKKISRIKCSAGPHDLRRKGLLIYCADHGVVEEGVTQTGQEVTRIVSENFARGCSTVNYLAQKAGADVFVTDVGIRTARYPEKRLVTGAVVDRKVATGTANLAAGPAMSVEQCRQALDIGRSQVRELAKRGYGILAAGEMGIGNTTPASALAAVFLGLEPDRVTGRGAGLSEEGLARKREVVRRAVARVREKGMDDPVEILAEVGGLEIVAMAGACLGAMECGVPLVIDGAICAVAALCAMRMDCRVTDYLLASHVSQEPVGGLALSGLGLEAILHGRMCLGEGSGAVMLYPLLDMAEAVYQGMGSFADYEITAYERYEREDIGC